MSVDEPTGLVSTKTSPSKRTVTETSPSKSKNRRRNDARRRSGGYKKQITNDQSDKSIKDQKLSNTNCSMSNENLNNQVKQVKDEQENVTVEAPESFNVDAGNRTNHQAEAGQEFLHEKNQLKEKLKLQNTQIQGLVEQVKIQLNKTKDLEAALLRTTKTCNQYEKLLEQEIQTRNNIEVENNSLVQTIARLKKQIVSYEKTKFGNDEIMRVMNATLMERETEISILKLKLTRVQTNPSSTFGLNSASSVSSVKQDPSRVYTNSGRSNSEFDRNSYFRTPKISEVVSVRASTSQLRNDDKDASVWATVPEELTPSKRPAILERNFRPHFVGLDDIDAYTGALGFSNNIKPFERDRRYKTLPNSVKPSAQEPVSKPNKQPTTIENSTTKPPHLYQVTNLDDSNSTSQSSGNKTMNLSLDSESKLHSSSHEVTPNTSRNAKDLLIESQTPKPSQESPYNLGESHYSTISGSNISSKPDIIQKLSPSSDDPKATDKISSSPVKFSERVRKMLGKFRRSDSATRSSSKTDLTSVDSALRPSNFNRGANRSTLVGPPKNPRAHFSPTRQIMNFQTDKPFAVWDPDMIVDWLTMIGLSMYASQCRRWVKCGAHIMNSTPAEVDKGLGITNHLHRKKLRLAISELNGDCDKITKAASKLDYLWVSRWLEDIGLPQYKEAFIEARVDGRVLNYLTVEDLVSLGVRSVLHHASIRCGIRVLRTIQFELQVLRRRATSEEIEQMKTIKQHLNQVVDLSKSPLKISRDSRSTGSIDLSLWTCHRIMEWLRLIDFAEFAPNLRGSGVHGGLIVFEDGFNFDTICSILSIPTSRTLLRRHLSTFFRDMIGDDLNDKKLQYKAQSTKEQLNTSSEVKTQKKSSLWFSKMRNPRVGQDDMDDYLCPMYPIFPEATDNRKRETESLSNKETQLTRIPERINI